MGRHVTVKIGSAGSCQTERGGQLPVTGHVAGRVIGVDDFDPIESCLTQPVQEVGLRRRPVPYRVGQHGHRPRGLQFCNGGQGIGFMKLDISRASGTEIAVKGLFDRRHVPALDQHAGEMDSSGDGSTQTLRILNRYRQAQFGQPVGQPLIAVGAAFVPGREPFGETQGRRRVEEISEDVVPLAVEPRADLDAADEFHPVGASLGTCLQVTLKRVMVGDGELTDPGCSRRCHQLRGRKRPVRFIGVSVKIDQPSTMLTMRRALTALSFLALAGCMNQKDPQADFLLFEDEYFNEYYRWSPSAGTQAGYHIFDDQMEDVSAAAHQNRLTVIQRQQQWLDSIPRDRLTPQQQIDHEFLTNRLAAERYDLETLETWRRNPMGYAALPGNAIDLLVKRNFAPPAERLRAVVARLRGVPAVLSAMRANVNSPAPEFTQLAIRIVNGSIPFFRDDIGAWGDSAAGNDLVLRHQFREANQRAVAALTEASRWLENDLQRRSTGTFALGADQFRRKLALEEMIDLPLDELERLGAAALDRDYEAFVTTARAIDPKRTPAAVMGDLQQRHPTASGLIPFVEQNAEAIRQFLVDREIVTIPSPVRATITVTPPYLRSGGFAFMDTPGAFETAATEAYYYVTPPDPSWPPAQIEEHLRLFNQYVADIVTIHEAYPGHYVQFLYAPQFPTKTRKLLFVASNAEGWAHYTEQMMIEEGFGGNDPRYRLAQLSEALLRDCRWLAGIRLHARGWTVEQAAALFREKGFQEPAIAIEEARRGTYDPTYLYYAFGKLAMYRLRSDYQKQLGAAYTLRKFHDAVLRQGSLPLPLLRRILVGVDGPLL